MLILLKHYLSKYKWLGFDINSSGNHFSILQLQVAIYPFKVAAGIAVTATLGPRFLWPLHMQVFQKCVNCPAPGIYTWHIRAKGASFWGWEQFVQGNTCLPHPEGDETLALWWQASSWMKATIWWHPSPGAVHLVSSVSQHRSQKALWVHFGLANSWKCYELCKLPVGFCPWICKIIRSNSLLRRCRGSLAVGS